MPYHPFVTRVAPSIVVRRERMLPLRGEVLVGTGSPVEPSDVVASAMLPSRMHLLNVVKALSINDEDLVRNLRVGVGDLVAEGDILAVKTGVSRFFGGAFRSPVNGTVVAMSNGRLLIQSTREILELKAYYKGTVINVMSGLGVIIEMNGALIQGIWASGREGFGVLRLGVEDPAESVDPEAIDMSYRGTVLVAGASIGDEALRRAQEMQVEGMVVGGLNTGLQGLVSSMPFPVIVTEGMGKVAISTPIFELLRMHESREASIRGTM